MLVLGRLVTVKVAAAEVAGGLHVPLTTQSYDPASLAVAGVRCNVDVVAPEIFPPLERFPPFLRHWKVMPAPEAVTENVTEDPETTV